LSDPENVKAYFRGARSATRLGDWETVEALCTAGARLGDADAFRQLEEHARTSREAAQRRSEAAREARERKERPGRELAAALVSKGYRVGLPQGGIGDKRPTVQAGGGVAWPVMLMYPEVGTSEAIEAAGEGDSFRAHLDVMLGPGAPPAPWDPERRYRPDSVEVYYMANAGKALTEAELAQAFTDGWPEGGEFEEVKRYGKEAVRPVQVDVDKALGATLREAGHVIPGVPMFFVLAKGSEYRDRFLQSV